MAPARTLGLCLLLLAPMAALAGSDTPRVTVTNDGTVVGRMVLDADEAVVREVLTDLHPTKNSSDVLEIRFVREGSCASIFRKTRGLFSPLELRTRLCPTSTGWRESLVETGDFNAYETVWELQPSDGGGTDLSISVTSKVNLMVPQSLVNRSAVRSMRESFADILSRILKKKQTE